jgi:hypothetical protein
MIEPGLPEDKAQAQLGVELFSQFGGKKRKPSKKHAKKAGKKTGKKAGKKVVKKSKKKVVGKKTRKSVGKKKLGKRKTMGKRKMVMDGGMFGWSTRRRPQPAAVVSPNVGESPWLKNGRDYAAATAAVTTATPATAVTTATPATAATVNGAGMYDYLSSLVSSDKANAVTVNGNAKAPAPPANAAGDGDSDDEEVNEEVRYVAEEWDFEDEDTTDYYKEYCNNRDELNIKKNPSPAERETLKKIKKVMARSSKLKNKCDGWAKDRKQEKRAAAGYHGVR